MSTHPPTPVRVEDLGSTSSPEEYADLFAAGRERPLRERWLRNVRFDYVTQEADDNMRAMMDYHYVRHDGDVLDRLVQGLQRSGLPGGR